MPENSQTSSGGLDPISSIIASVSNVITSIFGNKEKKKRREFEQAMYNEEADVQAIGGKIARWFDQACKHHKMPAEIAFHEESHDGWQVKAAGGIQHWLSGERARDRAYNVYKAIYPERSFWEDPCKPILTPNSLYLIGGALLIIIILYIISKSV